MPGTTGSGRDRDARGLLESAQEGDARCLAHGHTFDGNDSRVPVVVKEADGELEVWCRTCAHHYDKQIALEGDGE